MKASWHRDVKLKVHDVRMLVLLWRLFYAAGFTHMFRWSYGFRMTQHNSGRTTHALQQPQTGAAGRAVRAPGRQGSSSSCRQGGSSQRVARQAAVMLLGRGFLDTRTNCSG